MLYEVITISAAADHHPRGNRILVSVHLGFCQADHTAAVRRGADCGFAARTAGLRRPDSIQVGRRTGGRQFPGGLV